MSTRTPNLNLINPVASEKGALTTYVTNNNAIDTAYGQSLENVAPIEGSTASKNYAIGTYMVKDGGLYKVTAAIATGETITVGTNVTATSLNEAVADLNSAVATLSTKIGNVGNTSLQSQVSTLQDSVDSVQTGDVQLQAAAASRSSTHVTFQKTYNKTPTVVVQNTSKSTAWQYGLITHGVNNVTSSGFDIYVWNGNASNALSPEFKWVAFID